MSDCQQNSGYGLKTEHMQTKGQPPVGKTRENLVDALTESLDRLTGDMDVTEIEKILGEIDGFGPVAEDFDVEASLDRFFEDDVPEMAIVEQIPEKAAKTRGHRSLARIAIIAAALACLAMTTVQASGFNIFAAIVDWANEKFYISSENAPERDETPDGVGATLQDELDEYGIVVPLAPKVFPEGTQLVELTVRDMNGVLAFLARYESAGEKTDVSIRQTEEERDHNTELNIDNEIIPHVVGDITHSLVADVKQQKAIWKNGEWEISISTTLNQEQLIRMIDSIYE